VAHRASDTIRALEVRAYRVPTEQPETDGTFAWDATTVVVVRVRAHDRWGLGFSYAAEASAVLIDELLRDVVLGRDPCDVPGIWLSMVDKIRNVGRPGVASMAIAAVDTALWDLKARLFEVPLVKLLGMTRSAAPIYGSGGFTSYTDERLAGQLGGWVHNAGMPQVKMKIGTDRGRRPDRDAERIACARDAIGDDATLFVDANGAYTVKEAIRLAQHFDDWNVTWFEEPVSSDDLAGLHEIRDTATCDIAAGEYGYDVVYFDRMCAAGAVDVLQADVSRCAGITEWLRVAAIAAAHGLEISGHCAQSLHVAPACAVTNLRNLEYFHDHARVDRLLFEGVLDPVGGMLTPDLGRPGMGLELKEADAAPFLLYRTDPAASHGL
jgi:L-alanine-DL-glutamate epimerase-like enolase superfamily enzyme